MTKIILIISYITPLSIIKRLFSVINNNLTARPDFIIDPTTGKITGYKTGGADTVHPFNELTLYGGSFTGNRTITIPDTLSDKNFVLVVTGVYCAGGAGSNANANKSATIRPQINKSGNTLSISGCQWSASDIAFNVGVNVTYSIYYY